MISELDLRSLWTELDAYEREIAKETTTLSEVWVKMAQLKEKNEAETKEYVAAIIRTGRPSPPRSSLCTVCLLVVDAVHTWQFNACWSTS